jgi:hypothetical protein
MTAEIKTTKIETATEKMEIAIDGDHIHVSSHSRPIPQEELWAIYRNDFVRFLMDWIMTKNIDHGINAEGVHNFESIGGRTAQFIVVGNHHNLVEIKETGSGRYEWSIAGKHFCSYHLSDVVELIEAICDRVLRGENKIVSLHNEIDLADVIWWQTR